MKRIGVFPGSFDPFTKGHEDIVLRFLPIFDEIVIAIGINESKKYMYTLESRISHIKSLFENETKVTIEPFAKLTVDFCKEKGAQYLLRGLRNAVDADYERSIAQMNDKLAGIETLFLMCNTAFAPISSSIVREITKNKGDISDFVTKPALLIIN